MRVRARRCSGSAGCPFPGESNMTRTFANPLIHCVLPALLSVACATASAADVSFVEPHDGATVSNPVHVKFAVNGMKVAPAGDMTEGTGHHHLLIDGKPLTAAD